MGHARGNHIIATNKFVTSSSSSLWCQRCWVWATVIKCHWPLPTHQLQ